MNYKEIPAFIEFAQKNGANASVWEYRNHHKTLLDEEYSKYTVWQKTHPKYNDFVKVINNVKRKYNKSFSIPEIFDNLEPISLFSSIKNNINSLFS